MGEAKLNGLHPKVFCLEPDSHMEEVDRQIALLSDSSDFVRKSAAEALIKVGTSAIPALVKALNDTNWQVRRYAAEALGKIGDVSVVPDLIQAFESSTRTVRRYVTEALGKIGDISAVPILIKALKDTDSLVRWSAAKALQEIATKQPTVYLREAIPELKRLSRVRSDLSRVRSEREIWPVYTEALEAIEKATAGLKDVPIADTAPVASAQNLPVPVEGAPTTAPAPPVRKGILHRVFRR